MLTYRSFTISLVDHLKLMIKQNYRFPPLSLCSHHTYDVTLLIYLCSHNTYNNTLLINICCRHVIDLCSHHTFVFTLLIYVVVKRITSWLLIFVVITSSAFQSFRQHQHLACVTQPRRSTWPASTRETFSWRRHPKAFRRSERRPWSWIHTQCLGPESSRVWIRMKTTGQIFCRKSDSRLIMKWRVSSVRWHTFPF